MLVLCPEGGKHRDVPLPDEIAEQLDPSQQHLFFATQFWKQAFYKAVRTTARELGIQIQGVHRFRSNYAQNVYEELKENGRNDREARREVSRRLGHNRVEVTNSFIPPKP